jgi:hypothetical protein
MVPLTPPVTIFSAMVCAGASAAVAAVTVPLPGPVCVTALAVPTALGLAGMA